MKKASQPWETSKGHGNQITLALTGTTAISFAGLTCRATGNAIQYFYPEDTEPTKIMPSKRQEREEAGTWRAYALSPATVQL